MIRLPVDMSRDDVSQWLSGGVFLVQLKGKEPEPALWCGIVEGSSPIKVVCSLISGDGAQQVEVSYRSCFAVWPELGSFNCQTFRHAVHMERIQNKQYRRTFNERCTTVTVPWGQVVNPLLRRNIRSGPGWGHVYALPWVGTYPSGLEEAETWLRQGWYTVAINRRLVLAGNLDVDKRLLYMDGQLAATVVGGHLFPTCDDVTLSALETMVNGRYNAVAL